jgi:hypothetical protein
VTVADDPEPLGAHLVAVPSAGLVTSNPPEERTALASSTERQPRPITSPDIVSGRSVTLGFQGGGKRCAQNVRIACC